MDREVQRIMNVLLVIVIMGLWAVGGHAYNRPPPRQTLFTPHADSDTSPQQVPT